MSYTRTNWVDGNKPGINATNLNNMEKGIADAHEMIESTIATTTATTLENSHAGGYKLIGVNGKSEQESTKGYQLFDESKLATRTIGGATVTNNGDGSFTVSGSGTLSEGFSTVYVYSHEETLAMLKVGTLNLSTEFLCYPYVCMGLRDGSNKSKGEVNNSKTTTASLNITEELLATDGLYLIMGFYGASGGTIVANTFKPMVYQEGDGTWEKYTNGASPNSDYQQPINSAVVSEVKTCGNNLANMPDFAETTSSGITWSGKNGGITAKGTATGVTATISMGYGYEMPVKAGTYYVSGSNGDLKVHVRIVNAKGTVYYYNDRAFTLDGTEQLCTIYAQVTKGATVDATIYPMLNYGNTALPWEQYTETVATLSNPITLHGIGDVEDILTTENVERRFAEVVFDGTEDWRYNGTDTTDVYRIALPCDTSKFKCVTTSSEVANILCTHYVAGSPNDTFHLIQCITMTSGGFTLYDKNFNTNDISLYKAWLKENPITVLVPLAEPLIEELPTADKIALLSLATFDGTTHVSTDSEVQPTIEAEYGTSKVGAYTLEALNTAKRNEIVLAGLITE